MAILSLTEQNGQLFFDKDACKLAGAGFAVSYQNAAPFPHIAIDDLIDPALLGGLLDDFPATDGKSYFDREQERFKYQFAPDEVQPGRLKSLLLELNSEAFIAFLESMTGIKGLIPDPYYEGGGLHETKAGGHLSVHADFNIHGRMRLERRLNLLIYLNDDWSLDYGGELELWDQEMKACCVSVAPVLGRAVVFNTALDSFHGQPKKLSCPPDRSRRSIATYYYTAPENGVASLPKRTTNFKQRPGAEDRRDWKIGYKHFVNDWVPPKLQKLALRVIR
jgi:hypothetical protein